MTTNFKLDNKHIKSPSSFKIERYNITKSQRLADGTMSMDLIAKKRKFFFTYNAIDATDLNEILELLWESSSVFFELIYIESNVTKVVTVYAGAIPAELHRTDPGIWVWKNVTFNLIER